MSRFPPRSPRTRMDTIANNIANMNTAGYRADGGASSTACCRKPATWQVAYQPARTTSRGDAGPVSQTGNRLDVAVEGDGWLAISNRPPGTVNTRDGRMQIDRSRRTEESVRLPGARSGRLARSSSTRRAGRWPSGRTERSARAASRSARSACSSIPRRAKLTRFENSGVIPEQAGPAGRGSDDQRRPAGLRRGLERQPDHGDDAG